MLCTVAAASQVYVVDELEPIYPDQQPVPLVGQVLDAPRGGVAAVHLVLDGCQQGVPIQIEASRVGGQDPLLFQLIDVPVEENTGPQSRTERWDQAENPHVIRDAPFRVYEVLSPISDQQVLPSQSRTVIRLEWRIPADAPPGVYPFVLDWIQGAEQGRQELDLHIHAVQLPAPGPDTLGYTNWFSPQLIAKWHEVPLWSDAHFDMMRQYAALMAHGRQNMFWIRWPDFFAKVDGQWVLDDARLRRYVAVFCDAGLYWMEGAPFAGRPGGDWSSDRLELKMGKQLMTTPEGRQAFAQQARQIRAVIDAEGWRSRWVQHIADEPTDANANDYAMAAEMVRAQLGALPTFEATMTRSLVGAVDMWCPQVQEWYANQDFFEARQQAGDQVWVYTCLRPGGPWLNRLLDQERLRQVYFGWGAAKEGWDGYLHWGLSHWKADPFQQSVVDHPAMPGTNNRLPAGDTHVLYPGTDGPWSGLRFEAHRMGLEDHALLQMLPQDQSRILIDALYQAGDNWEHSVPTYRAVRRQLLQAASLPGLSESSMHAPSNDGVAVDHDIKQMSQ